jgi:hypothetical protein
MKTKETPPNAPAFGQVARSIDALAAVLDRAKSAGARGIPAAQLFAHVMPLGVKQHHFRALVNILRAEGALYLDPTDKEETLYYQEG